MIVLFAQGYSVCEFLTPVGRGRTSHVPTTGIKLPESPAERSGSAVGSCCSRSSTGA